VRRFLLYGTSNSVASVTLKWWQLSQPEKRTMMKVIKFLPIIAFSGYTFADLPLNLDDILLDQKETRFEIGVDYYNAYGTYDTNTYLGIRYGINNDIEVYGRTTDTNNFTLGLNTQLLPDNDTAALMGFAEVSNADTAMVGLTAYRSIDPVVLSITTGYQKDLKNLWLINPSIGFVANSEVTLTAGLNMSLRQPDTTQTALELGLGYSFSKQDMLSVKVQTDISDYSGSNISLKWIHKLNTKGGEQPVKPSS
jgi:outer membrane autotransporter protein